MDDDKSSDIGLNSMDPLRNLEIFSAKSVDDSRASVYYTPTDGNTSPELQTSPIHINYINDTFDAPIFNLRRGSNKNYFIDKKMNKYKFNIGHPSGIGGSSGGGSDDEKSITGSLGDCARALSPRKKRKHERYGSGSYNPSLFSAPEEDENDEPIPSTSQQIPSKCKINESNATACERENLLLKTLFNDQIDDFIEHSNGKVEKKKDDKMSKRLKNEYYYSLEDVVGMIDAPKSNFTSTELVHDATTGKTNTLFNIKRSDSDCSGNAVKNSISLPEISNAKLVHGKHVILAIEDPDCHIDDNNPDHKNDSRL